jgi:hypothetical protein
MAILIRLDLFSMCSHPEPLTSPVASPPPSSRAARTGRGGVLMHHGNRPAQNQPNRIGVGGVTEIEARSVDGLRWRYEGGKNRNNVSGG